MSIAKWMDKEEWMVYKYSGVLVKVLVTQSCPRLSVTLWTFRLPCPWDSPGKNTGVCCHFLLQGIFPTQGLNPGLLHCRQILSHLSHQGSPVGYYSAVIKKEVMPSATVWMDPDVILLSEVREAEKGKYYVIDHLHLKSKKRWCKWTYLQNRNRLTDKENKLMLTKGERGGIN